MILVRYGIAIVLLISTMFALQDTVKVKRKDSKKAFVYSLFPGMGQAYNGKWIKSALVNRHRYLEKRNKFAWWMGIIYVYAMIDAIVDAHLHSFDDLMESPLDKENSKGNNYAE